MNYALWQKRALDQLVTCAGGFDATRQDTLADLATQVGASPPIDGVAQPSRSFGRWTGANLSIGEWSSEQSSVKSPSTISLLRSPSARSASSPSQRSRKSKSPSSKSQKAWRGLKLWAGGSMDNLERDWQACATPHRRRPFSAPSARQRSRCPFDSLEATAVTGMSLDGSDWQRIRAQMQCLSTWARDHKVHERDMDVVELSDLRTNHCCALRTMTAPAKQRNRGKSRQRGPARHLSSHHGDTAAKRVRDLQRLIAPAPTADNPQEPKPRFSRCTPCIS